MKNLRLITGHPQLSIIHHFIVFTSELCHRTDVICLPISLVDFRKIRHPLDRGIFQQYEPLK